jgi:hypothetical protein
VAFGLPRAPCRAATSAQAEDKPLQITFITRPRRRHIRARAGDGGRHAKAAQCILDGDLRSGGAGRVIRNTIAKARCCGPGASAYNDAIKKALTRASLRYFNANDPALTRRSRCRSFRISPTTAKNGLSREGHAEQRHDGDNRLLL